MNRIGFGCNNLPPLHHVALLPSYDNKAIHTICIEVILKFTALVFTALVSVI